MIQLVKNFSLTDFNTFGIHAQAKAFVSVRSIEELKEALKLNFEKRFILGGGSNILLTKDIEGLVIHNAIKGIEVVKEDKNAYEVFVSVGAGENWHHLVVYCLENGWGGIENLALIPGNVGTAPIQNIGAYGVELKDVFHTCTAINRKTLETKIFTLEDCQFGYRESVFKNEVKGQYVITSVTLKLTTANHKLHTQYGAISDTLLEEEITMPSIQEVAAAVIKIRQSKLPDPKKIGNSGSFFKNPMISQNEFKQLRERFEAIPFYPVGNGMVKVPAGWLIEQAGFKGKRFGEAGVHDKQALVLINHGSATGKAIWDLAQRILATVKETFDIVLQTEVNII